MNKKEQSLSWEAFQQMGNPENAPETPKEDQSEHIDKSARIRIHLERQGGNRKASIIKGMDADDDTLEAYATKFKKKCGVGGAVKNREIIIQGDQRDVLIELLKAEGFQDIKKAGG